MFTKNPKLNFSLTLAIIVLSSILVYNLSISNTIEKMVEIKSLKAKLSAFTENTEIKFQNLKEREKITNQIFENEINKGQNFQQEILRFLTPIGKRNELKITKIPQVEEIEEKGYKFQFAQIELEGNFHELLKTALEIEKYCKAGKLVSINFHSKEVKSKNKNYLYAGFLFQKISI